MGRGGGGWKKMAGGVEGRGRESGLGEGGRRIRKKERKLGNEEMEMGLEQRRVRKEEGKTGKKMGREGQ